MSKIPYVLAAPAIALSVTYPSVASAPQFDTPAPVAFMEDLSSGAILYQKDADRRMPPASMAKMMTVYVAFDLIKRGELKLDQQFEVRPETWQKWHGPAAGSTMFLSSGEKVSVANLLYWIVTLSGNDACVVLAEGISGTEDAFVQRMNEAAKRIGLTNSHFGTSNGWRMDEVLPSADVIARLNEALPLEALEPNYPGETAQRWQYRDGGGEVGVISSVTRAFCGTCSRARLSTEGKLYLCLFASAGYDLRTLLRNGASDAQISTVIGDIWQGRTDRYSALRTAATGLPENAPPKVEMSYIGG